MMQFFRRQSLKKKGIFSLLFLMSLSILYKDAVSYKSNSTSLQWLLGLTGAFLGCGCLYGIYGEINNYRRGIVVPDVELQTNRLQVSY